MNEQQGNSRRDFLRRSAAAGAGALLAGTTDLWAAGGASAGAAVNIASR
nr:twin-arginine translocation signal domain-containing protein [Gemmatimonadota bacterium]NIU79967.1 twin-arginine translocation signal domain-containing protein [Gammaproteobacteria bacterium]NIX48427.1 twin-arginine translocation signal domain-containing protein [Gemmatimonadota bacterium]